MLNGIILGVMTFLSLVLSFRKLPQAIKNFILRHKLLADIGAGALIFVVLGAVSKSIVAIVGAIMSGLLVGIALEVTDKEGKNET